ncbi:putative actin-binding protein Fragmin [Rhizodiscina lignyota]|uniref:Actin-binding protein Fragmin n=1 Tax=Rhizodiscina lignyota TaxID=1504668 RepID=A0A9P4IM67_9PEZI|nr:putative actin-binding protein Fragmin [Rhizodiscina lignyota]
MPPHEGLVHLKEYDVKDSNVELIGTNIDHDVKYKSAATEPAWNDGQVGQAGLRIWRIEDFEVVPWPKNKYGQFYDGDSYIVLHSYKIGGKEEEKLAHDIFFWLGSKTSQDEAGTAAYKTVELDEFLHGVATQYREIQQQPSENFVALFPRLQILKGGVRSGFTHVEEEKPKETLTLLRIFKHPAAGRTDSIVVHEVEPTWESLDEDDVFVLDRGDKIWVWQGKKCSPMEKAKAAQVVHDMTIAKHVDVEVLSQAESRSRLVVNLLGGGETDQPSFKASRPLTRSEADGRPRRLFRLSDASGKLEFGLVKEGDISNEDLDGNDLFILDTGKAIWVWQGASASTAEKGVWIRVAQAYVRQLQEAEGPGNEGAHLTPISKVTEGSESRAFIKALAA